MNELRDIRESDENEIVEGEIERNTRKQTLINMSKREREESRNWPSSIDIRELEGNLYLKRMIKINYAEISNLHQNKSEFLERLRLSIKRVKSYVSVFDTKAKLLLKILINLMENFGKELRKRLTEYDQLDLVFSPWIDIIKNHQFCSEVLKSIEKEKVHQSNKLGDSNGERFRSCSQKLNLNIQNLQDLITENEFEIGNQKNELLDEVNEPHSDCKFTKSQFLGEYKNIIFKNKKFIEKIESSIMKYEMRLNKMISKQLYMELLEKIDQSYKLFSSAASKKVRELLEGENIFSDTNPENNLFILEFRICNLMKKFREKIDEKIIFKFYGMMKEVESIIFNHHSCLNGKLKEFCNAGITAFGEETWVESIFTLSFFNQSPKNLIF